MSLSEQQIRQIIREEIAKNIPYQVREELRIILDKGLMYSAEAKPQQKPQTNILEQFPPEYRNYLTLKDGKIYCQFISKDVWSEINQVARDLGYEYIGGKNAHWRRK